MAVILVTGASRGIGRGVAERLCEAGEEVVGLARNPRSAPFEMISVDVSSEKAIKDLAREMRRRASGVSALVNAAGIASMNLALMASSASIRSVVDTNLLGTMFMCQAVAPLIIRSGGGSIVNFSTIAVSLALQGESAYVASKAGVEAYSRTLARELSGHHITVNCIAPGPINTELLKGISSEQIDLIRAQQVIRDHFEVSDVADVVELLLSPKSRSLSGHVLHIGGV